MDSQPPRAKFGKVKYVEAYDFKRPKLFSKEIMRTLRVIHEAVALNLGRIFSASLRYKVDVTLAKLDQQTPDDFTGSLASPSAIYIMEVDEVGSEMVVVLPPEFCLHLIERQSGGHQTKLNQARPLTVIEEKILSRVIKNVNGEIIRAWNPYNSLNFTRTSYESKPENIHLGSVDPTITAQFKADLNGTSIDIMIAYTYSLLKEALNDTILKKDLRSMMERLSDEDMESYQRTIASAKVNVQGLLGTTRLTLDEILKLKEGDVVPLGQKADQPLDVLVSGVKKITGYPGVVQGRKAIKVFELLEEINEQELV